MHCRSVSSGVHSVVSNSRSRGRPRLSLASLASKGKGAVIRVLWYVLLNASLQVLERPTYVPTSTLSALKRIYNFTS